MHCWFASPERRPLREDVRTKGDLARGVSRRRRRRRRSGSLSTQDNEASNCGYRQFAPRRTRLLYLYPTIPPPLPAAPTHPSVYLRAQVSSSKLSLARRPAQKPTRLAQRTAQWRPPSKTDDGKTSSADRFAHPTVRLDCCPCRQFGANLLTVILDTLLSFSTKFSALTCQCARRKVPTQN